MMQKFKRRTEVFSELITIIIFFSVIEDYMNG